jgi:hypothetical protein
VDLADANATAYKALVAATTMVKVNDGAAVQTHRLYAGVFTPIVGATNDVGLSTTAANGGGLTGITVGPSVTTGATGTLVAGVAINVGGTYNGMTVTNHYGIVIQTPTGTVTPTNKYALCTASTAGNVGIGTMTPTYQLQLSTDSAGKPTSEHWTIVSDEKVKKNVVPFTDGLAKLKLFNPISYKYTGDYGTPVDAAGVGLVAQDVQAFAPEMVSVTKAKKDDLAEREDDVLGLNTHNLHYIMLNAIKELSIQLDAMQIEVDKLKKV